MALREVPRWALWLVVLGLMLPLFGFVNVKSYAPERGLLWNISTQEVEVPFFKGPNPISCITKAINGAVTGKLFGPDSTTYACHSPIYVSFFGLVIFSALLLIVGLYYQFRGVELPNIWPTEWTPLKAENVMKTGDSALPHIASEKNDKTSLERKNS